MDRTQRALSMIGEISTAPTSARAIDLFQDALEPFGVVLFRTATFQNPVRTDPDLGTVMNWPEEWRRFYDGARAFTFDPVVAAAGKPGAFFWRDIPRPDTAPVRNLMSSAKDIGMVDGFSAVRVRPGELPAMISVAGHGFDWTPVERGVVSFVAETMMARVLVLREVQVAPAIRALGRRETQLLQHAAVGHDDKVIARELELSHATVRGYWRSIRDKLGAMDRAHAVAIGIWAGEIDP